MIKIGARGPLFVSLPALFLLLDCINILFPLIVANTAASALPNLKFCYKNRSSIHCQKLSIKKKRNHSFVVHDVFVLIFFFLSVGLVLNEKKKLYKRAKKGYLEDLFVFFNCVSLYIYLKVERKKVGYLGVI